MPISKQRSLVPMRSASTPGTAAISSQLATACGDSIITTTSVSSFTTRAVSAMGMAAKFVCWRPPPMERLPTGGKRHASATRFASCALSTCGNTIPCAPLSRRREACQCSKPDTRGMGETPTASEAHEICEAVSRSIELCSQSMKSQSKPAVFAIWAMSTVRALRTPRPMASLPARSWRRAWLGTAVMIFSCFSFTTIFDDVGGLTPGVAAADPAAVPQRQLLALQENFAVAVDGDEGAVGAVVLEHPFVLAPLDGAVLARGLVVVDD